MDRWAGSVASGALVSPASGPVASVSTLDPTKVILPSAKANIWIGTGDSDGGHREEPEEPELDWFLRMGSVYPRPGSVYLRPAGQISNTGRFEIADCSNPGNILRPGGYAKVRAALKVQKDALLVANAPVRRHKHLSAGSSGWRGQSKHPVGAAWRARSQPVDCEGRRKACERVVAEGDRKCDRAPK